MVSSLIGGDAVTPDAPSEHSFPSIVFAAAGGEQHPVDLLAPECFSDLLLDQVVDALVKGHDEQALLPYFYRPLTSVDAVSFRHEVWRDLDDARLLASLRRFSDDMREVRQRVALAAKSRFDQFQRALHLDAVERYCACIHRLAQSLEQADLRSTGLCGLRSAFTKYATSPAFENLMGESTTIRSQLDDIRYSINVRGPRVRVLRYEGEADYGVEIEEAFARFQQGAVKDYRAEFSDWPNMNHVEAFVADRVAKLFPEVFARLRSFYERSQSFLDLDVARFDREVQFYLAYLDYITPLKAQGLSFCLPVIHDGAKNVLAEDAFDLALARKLAAQRGSIVRNDFRLEGDERIIIVSGPNQGGKTTFARMFGQLHFLASLGLPVPGRRAALVLFDELFTHFGKEEDENFEAGKLEDDLLRIREVLRRASGRSVIVMNEIFSSTTTQDALDLGTSVINRIIDLDALCVVVTFLDELTLLGPSVVSMTSSVNPEDYAQRTFKIARHPADGLAYAIAIATKHGLTYDRLRERLTP